MKTSTWATALLLAILMIVGFGCSTDKTGGGPNPGDVNAVQVVMYEDTVTFIPGDSVAVPGFVVVTDRGSRVVKGVQVTVSSTPLTVGQIEWVDPALRDTSNDQGRVYFNFRSYARPANVTITAYVGTIVGAESLVVLQSSSFIHSLTINLSKPLLWVSSSAEDSSQVTCTIKDSSAAGIPGVSLRLSATGGRFKPLPPTDSTGRAQTWWYSSGDIGTFTITVQAGSLDTSVNIRVEPLPEYRGTLDLTTSNRKIRADGVSQARITATLKDQYSTAVVGDTIKFSTPRQLGSIQAWAITDSEGIAQAYFSERGGRFSQNPLDSAWVVGRHERWGLFDTVGIFVEEASAVELVHFTASGNTGIAGVDSASVLVTAYYEDATPVEGMKASFYSTCGRFTQDTVWLYNGTHSQTPISWRFCNQTTSSVAPAKLWVKVGGVTSDTLRMFVNAGAPRLIDVISAPVIPMNEQLIVTAFVWDSLRNAVGSGNPVFFESTFGTLSPRSPVSTDDDGIAEVRLWPSGHAGQVIIKGTVGVYVDSTVATILADAPGTIRLSIPDPSVQVRGTGGIDHTPVYAYVNDVHGNPVQDGLWVTFTILPGAPTGCTINGVADTSSAQTAAGVASVTFNAGMVPGPVSIQACTDLATGPFCVSVSNMSVVAGPPAHILIQPTDVGVDVDGVAWDVSMGALVGDLFNNPVRDSIAIFFDLEPEIALVLSDTVVTGNGSHFAGVAFTFVRYPSDRTFDHVFITARTAGPNPVSTTIDYILPLQTPTISLNCEPATWHYGIVPGWCIILCESIVKDGHNRLINGAKVLYQTTRGRFWTTSAHTVERNSQLTGPLGNPNFGSGYAALYLCEQAQFLFPPLTTEITADVQVEVQGYGAIDTQPINFRQ
ncbi:MAG: Ig-like domain-containing protein [bacterium]|nr:Ig-like domain-containing protein [bacterium]